jgi:CRISPR-associated protein (TIGR02710 family)
MDFADELHAFRERCAGRTVAGLLIPGSRQAVTAALLIGALQPQRVAFLLTPDTLDLPDQAAVLLHVSGADWVRYTDDHTDALQIYRSLRTVIEAWADLPRDRLAVDLTGGTKPMSVGLAKAAYVLGIPALYIESDFGSDPSGRSVPIPGSQRLIVPPDPYAVFGDLEAAEAQRLFNAHDYPGAQRIYADLARRVPPPANMTYALYADLARAYAAWDAFDLPVAEQTLRGLVAANAPLRLEKPQIHEQAAALTLLGIAARRATGRDAQALETLADPEAVLALLGSLYANARRRQAQGRYDTAALLLYRCLELIGQHRLATWGVLAEQPDFQELQRQQPRLDAAYRAVEQQLGWRPRGLPQPNRNGMYAPIALFNGYMLLAALADPLVAVFPIEQIRERSQARNKSILAHGYRLITQHEYMQFASVVDTMLQRLFAVLGRDRDEWEQTYTFVQFA